MIIPLWAVYGICALLVGAVMPLIQEKRQAEGRALAYWNKVFSAGLMVPFVLVHGLPTDIAFYTQAFISALLWCAADVSYFRAIPQVGAGVVSRLLPVAVIGTFFLWFPLDPRLVEQYIAAPGRSVLILLAILGSAFFAMRLRHCAVSLKGARLIWPLLLASALGPIVQKLSLYHAPAGQGPYAFTLVQALMMIALWSVYYAARPPYAPGDSGGGLRSKYAIKTGALVSVFSGFGVVLTNFALIHTEHPAYLSVLLLMSSLVILLYHRITGRRDGSDIASGLGIVACAILLVICTRF